MGAVIVMTTRIMSVTAKEIMAQHQEALIDYARRVLVNEEFLEQNEADDLAVRMLEFMAVGSSFSCTEKELVMLLYRGLFRRNGGGHKPADGK